VRQAAERSLGDGAVLLAGEGHPPVFELDDLVAGLLGEGVDCGGVPEIVRPLHRVVGVEIPGVLGVECGVDAALGGPGV
jgi:hypothetical protein